MYSFSKRTYIIAEIGQNHQGSVATAKQLILAAKNAGADCAKFQRTCLPEKFNTLALQRPYVSEHSWGKTYGEHKRFLEFKELEFRDLKQYAESVNIAFSASAMDIQSLRDLIAMEVPFIKIGSGDVNNFELIEEAAVSGVPLIISTGMQCNDAVKRIYDLVSKYHKRFALLHCVSAYPTPIDDINLTVINSYQDQFPDIPIGYSGHELGSLVSVSAVAMGAKIIERHLTLDKFQRGSDHKCSLLPEEFDDMVQQIRFVERARGDPVKAFQPSERLCYEKLGKTIVANRNLDVGRKLEKSDLVVKVAVPRGLDGSTLRDVVGRKLLVAVKRDESLLESYLDGLQ